MKYSLPKTLVTVKYSMYIYTIVRKVTQFIYMYIYVAGLLEKEIMGRVQINLGCHILSPQAKINLVHVHVLYLS